MYQKFITKELEKKFAKYPLGSQDGKDKSEIKVIAKFFNPMGVGTWLVTEAQKQENGKYLFFGMAELGYEWEYGYFSQEELENVRLPFGMHIERDMWLSDNATLEKLTA